jgi:hypothetical protein
MAQRSPRASVPRTSPARDFARAVGLVRLAEHEIDLGRDADGVADAQARDFADNR